MGRQHLDIPQGSLKELKTHLLLAERVDLLERRETTPIQQQVTATSRLLRSLIGSLKRKQS